MFFYLGIDTCLPEIERQRRSAFYHYETEELSDRISKKIIKKASYILNKDYDALTQHKAGKRAFYGVQTSSGLTYSSLSMGTGEQRVIRILDVLFRAPNYSMILIDELDLLLHNNAIRRLIEIINQEAVKAFINNL